MATQKKDNLKTLVIDKWNGRLSRYRDGDINSGIANFYPSFGYDCLAFSGTLTFTPTVVDITGGVITDMIMAAKVRVENGTTFVYAIGHMGRLYKIQVNNTTTKNPNYDTPVLLTTLANSQTFLFGSSLDFFQSASGEKIWIGHDAGITSIKFDGTSETNFIGGSWVTNVPRQQQQFIGKLFFTNGNNLASVDSTETITSYAALNPALPLNTQIRSLGTQSSGTYLVMVVTRAPQGQVTATTQDTNTIASASSSLVYWNGIDLGASSSSSYPAFSLTGYYNFSQAEYIFGLQVGGPMFGDTTKVIEVLEFDTLPYQNAIQCSGDFVGWMACKWSQTTARLSAVQYLYGTIDSATPVGLYRQLIFPSTLSGNADVVRVPCWTAVSSFASTGINDGYFNASTNAFGLMGTGKSYFSTLEYNGTTTKYGYYKMGNVNDAGITSCQAGVYETQHQIFTSKVKATEVRVYMEPPTSPSLVSFTIDLIGIDGGILPGGSFAFSSGNQISSTQDRVKYVPNHAPTSCLGLRVTNAGYLTPLIHRVEIDYEPMGN